MCALIEARTNEDEISVKTLHPLRLMFALPLIAACGTSTSPQTTVSAQAAHTNQPRSSNRTSVFEPLKTFAPLSLPDPVNRYRSANGAPGPDYWQNGADYEIHATLDPSAKELRANEIITYTNNSPDALASLWLQLDQNTYRKDARSTAFDDPAPTEFTDGYLLDSVEVDSESYHGKIDYRVSDTRMQIPLPRPLKAHGGQLRIRIQYHYTIPGLFGGRTSWVATQKGDIYDIAQWYPRMAVYDDLRGWDTQPYLANEFYLEYGHIDYYVTAPSNMLVAGSGELQNPQEVLTKAELQRLDQARASDRTVTIRSAAEIDHSAGGLEPPATLTWHFRMDKTRDVAFSASNAFVWDAARIQLPGGGRALAMSFYPIESGGDAAWGRSTEYLKHAVEYFSGQWFVYPYPVAVNVAGGTSGMEYPGMLFDGMKDTGKDLFAVTVHEIGHTWFPMVVGFNERRNAWMDEGFNTFIDIYESDAFQSGVYGPKRDPEYAPGGGSPADEILSLMNDPDAPAILTRADAIKEKYRHPVTYFKSALGLVLLREQILGPQRFDWAFRKFIRDWAYRHPSPSDFFRAMDSEGGEDLSWFWRGWYLNNWTLDLAVQDVRYADGEATIAIANRGRLVLPAIVQVTYLDGSRTRVQLPVETWMQKTVATLHLASKQPVASVVIDPDHLIPDIDRGNNEWKK